MRVQCNLLFSPLLLLLLLLQSSCAVDVSTGSSTTSTLEQHSAAGGQSSQSISGASCSTGAQDFIIGSHNGGAPATSAAESTTTTIITSASSGSSTGMILPSSRASTTAAMAQHAGKPYVIGRGCDPNRAAFAKRMWEPALGVDLDTATSDGELLQLLTSGRKCDVFFIAPGQVSLIRSGRIDGDAMKHLVKQHQPTARIVEIDDVSRALPLLTQALGEALGMTADQGGPKAVKPLTEDWPFVD